ncbi:MAG: hypothetical protein QXV84_06155 [Conexivisphaerales archaeon]
MILKLLKWSTSIFFYSLATLITILLITGKTPYGLIAIAISAMIYFVGVAIQNRKAASLSWFMLAATGVMVFALKPNALFFISLLTALCLAASLSDLSFSSITSGIVNLTDSQLEEYDRIGTLIALASFLSVIISLPASLVSIYFTESSKVLPNPIIGILLFGSFIFLIVLMAVSDSFFADSKNDSS